MRSIAIDITHVDKSGNRLRLTGDNNSLTISVGSEAFALDTDAGDDDRARDILRDLDGLVDTTFPKKPAPRR